MTGVPHAIASIIINPKGSSQSIGEIRGARPHQQLDLVGMADLSDVLDPAAEMRADEFVEVADLERLAALRGDLERDPGLERDREARWAPLSGLMRPRKTR